QRLSHAHFALAIVVVPAVVEEVDAVVERRANNSDALLLIMLRAEVVSANPDHRHPLAGVSEGAIWDRRLGRIRKLLRHRTHNAGSSNSFQEIASIHATPRQACHQL